MKQLCVGSPVGPLLLREENGKLTGLSFLDEAVTNAVDETPLLLDAKKQLAEYFAGTRKTFSLPLAFSGTPFQEKIWRGMQAIPYGEVRSKN